MPWRASAPPIRNHLLALPSRTVARLGPVEPDWDKAACVAASRGLLIVQDLADRWTVN
jgi:hypothetical protein